MPTDDTASPRLGDAPVYFSIFLVLLAALPAWGWAAGLWDHLSEVAGERRLRYAGAGLLGAVVGCAEILTRYRDAPWVVIRSVPALAFIALNASAGLLAMATINHFTGVFSPPADPVAQVLVAGFGAMVVLRAKVATLRQPGGTEVAIGPDIVVDAFLGAVSRDVDRRRAIRRIQLVTAMARGMKDQRFAIALPYLKASLLAFQTMESEEKLRLAETMRALVEDDQLKDFPDEVKFALCGYDLLTAFGDRAFDGVFEQLRLSIKP